MSQGRQQSTLRHQTVMLKEAVAALDVRSDGCYLDGTFGRGGHSAEILSRLGKSGRLFALDQDAEAISHAETTFSGDSRFHIEQRAFSGLLEFSEDHQLTGKINGILLDLGVSSPQLDDESRGFSFMRNGPLDMRMNREVGQSAAAWLSVATEDEITRVLKEYGEERFARRIARAVVETRVEHPIQTTAQLVSLIEEASPVHERHKHPATRSFQAIRIFVNAELEELRACLEQALEVLAVGARLVVISFHSLEDRMVKRFMRDASQGERYPKGLPIPDSVLRPRMRLIGRAKRASDAEIRRNPRARSAIMRVAEVLA